MIFNTFKIQVYLIKLEISLNNAHNELSEKQDK